MKIHYSFIALMSVVLLAGCKMLPSHVSDDHAHTDAELVNPDHHTMTGSHMDHSMHTMDHATMVTDELSFISEMIPHHQEAVDTSTTLLLKTQNLKLKTMLENIISGQDQEIIMMKGRLSDYYSGSDYKPMYMNMMRDTSGITDIKILEKMYMEDMIQHHQGAVDMARKILDIMTKQDPVIRLTEAGMKHRNEVKAFAQAIIDAQTKEINEFKELLKSY